MPSLDILQLPLPAAGRLAAGSTARAGWLLAAAPAAADHGGPVTPPAGVDWAFWLLVVGAVVAAVLAGWALLAPDRGDARTPRDPSAPGASGPRDVAVDRRPGPPGAPPPP